MTMQNIERMLEDQSVPSPPEGLVDQIKAEIPDNIEIYPGLTETAIVVPWHRRRNLRLAVAAIFVVALTAVVSWQMRRGPMLGPDRGVEPVERVVVGPLDSDSDESVIVSGPDTEGEENRLRNSDVAAGEAAGRGPAPLVEAEQGFLGQRELKEPGALSNPADGVISTPAEQKIARVQASIENPENRNEEAQETPNSVHKVTDEMIEQAMERSFEGEVTVTGSYIPRADYSRVSPVSVLETPPRSARSSDTWRDRYGTKRRGSTDGHPREAKTKSEMAAPSTGGTDEPNDQPYGDVFFREYGVNPFIDTEDDSFSTFGLEVDTGSYNVIRRYLLDENLPPREAVRLEEIVNAFDYGDGPPDEGDFALSAEGAPSPYADGLRYKIVRFGVTARTVSNTERPPAVLTFVVDVSGSMNQENRLVLVKRALFALLDNLREDDRVGLVIYGSHGKVLLDPTTDHDRISRAIDQLRAGGSTNAEEGLVLAYQLADRFRESEYINRVILCSDGVANVGRTGPESILERIKGWADNGIELTTVGFGMGNYNDVLMEQLADAGDGRYAYVDAFDEARRLFVEELSGTLLTIGSEAKAQVEFNPEVVSRYRLLGYENRDIADEDFRNPAVDAGEIGAGHTATAVYEIKLKRIPHGSSRRELATLRVRYRPHGSDEPVEIERRMKLGDLTRKWNDAPSSLRLATLVVEYGEILKGSYWARTGDMNDVLSRGRRLARELTADERVADWLELVEIAAELLDEADEDGVKITD